MEAEDAVHGLRPRLAHPVPRGLLGDGLPSLNPRLNHPRRLGQEGIPVVPDVVQGALMGEYSCVLVPLVEEGDGEHSVPQVLIKAGLVHREDEEDIIDRAPYLLVGLETPKGEA